MNTKPAFFSEAEPDPVGLLLGTGYSRFETPFGISGLAKWDGDRLDILAAGASKPRSGQFRTFIEQAKKHFAHIYVWEDWNPIVTAALERYGFAPAEQTEADGDKITGWHWPA